MSDDDQHVPPKVKAGYRNPPEEHRFKPGVSGNPKGRPKKAAMIETLRREFAAKFDAEMRRRVSVIENGKPRRKSKLEIAVSNVTNKAAKGDLKNLSVVFGQLDAIESYERSKPRAEAHMKGMTAEEAREAYLEFMRGY